jgi:hypothetical protein
MGIIDDILKVSPPYLKILGAMQNENAGMVKTATAKANGIGSQVKQTHGSYTDDFNDVMGLFDASRIQAGGGIQDLCLQLATNLISAAASYLKADQFGAGALNQQVNI